MNSKSKAIPARVTGAIYYNNDPLSGFLSLAFNTVEGVPTYKGAKEFLFNIVAAYLKRNGWAVREGMECLHVDLASSTSATVFRLIHAIGEGLGGFAYRVTLSGYERQGSNGLTSERFNFEVTELPAEYQNTSESASKSSPA